MNVLPALCIGITCLPGACKGDPRRSCQISRSWNNSHESCGTMRVLGIKPELSVSAVSALNH